MTKVMNFKWKLSKNQKGLTLIELLAVVVILGILAAIGGVAVLGGFDEAKANADATNKQIITDAIQRYIMAGNDTTTIEAAADKADSETALGALVTEGYLNSVPTVQGGSATSYYAVAVDGTTKVVTVTITP